jgi:EAL domain-containing protein (putative c-di-GMP-specific phosphodiesterase class I)/GGDEF domain-containing protein
MSFYTEEKERSHRFVLALRMGLPIFLISAITLFALFTEPYSTVSSLVFLSFLLLATAVYFIFFLINQSAYEAITDSTTHTFTNDYFKKIYYQWTKHYITTLVMISIDNLTTINEKYGIKNGDIVLNETIRLINEFFALKEIKKLPICRYKGGDILLVIRSEKENILPLIELFLTKYQENSINEMEVQLSAVVIDTKHVKKYEEVITRLYELQYASVDKKTVTDTDELIPEQLEHSVLDALEHKRYSVATQNVSCEKNSMAEVTFKLINSEGGLIHQSRFIPLLNRLGKMREYESQLLEIVAKMAAVSADIYIVSLSAVTMRNGLFFQHALEMLQRYPEAKNKIIILFDEKEYSPQIKRFREQIAQYRAVGYKIALDKYGGNHVSMMYLKEFHVDFVRFDALYTRHIMEEKYQNILQGLNMTAHLCGAATWISMIEDENSDAIAKQLKINCQQGNYHGKIIIKSINM